MATYSAINIGPIIKTLSMARRPRELWAASYMFSHLMKCIIEELQKEKLNIISPATTAGMRKDMGLLPDRVYVEGEVDEDKVKEALIEYAWKLGISPEYLNVMFEKAEEPGGASKAIKELNDKLDIRELFVKAVSGTCENSVRELLLKPQKLYEIAGLKEDNLPIVSLGDLALADNKKDEYSFSNYFCIVQADGDGMGSTITNAKDKGEIEKISQSLLRFGQRAVDCIKDYSKCSLPLYAGGDDLLFLAPVATKGNGTIFDLICKLDEIYAEELKGYDTTMSYGISINYHKFPLYEALESARHQLFGVAKKVKGKNAIAWDLRKHSGGAFAGAFSKNNKDLFDAFKDLISVSGGESNVVSAVAHKIRANEGLLKFWLADDNYRDRNAYFFNKFMEGVDGSKYKEAALELLNVLYADAKEKNLEIKPLIQTMYGMLRTAKFVKGEKGND